MEKAKDFSQFSGKITGKKKIHKVTNSWGIYAIYKHIRKNRWYNIGRPLKEGEFYSIIRRVNELIAENIANGISFKMPERMGTLELRKSEVGVSFVNGKLRNTYIIDWNKTLKLWFEDEEARKNKTLLRNEDKWLYHVVYNKRDATYENCSFYEFTLNNFLKKALSDNIKQGKTDALW